MDYSSIRQNFNFFIGIAISVITLLVINSFMIIPAFAFLLR